MISHDLIYLSVLRNVTIKVELSSEGTFTRFTVKVFSNGTCVVITPLEFVVIL